MKLGRTALPTVALAAVFGTVALGAPELGSDIDTKFGLEQYFDEDTVKIVNEPVELPRHEYGRIADRAAMRIVASAKLALDQI